MSENKIHVDALDLVARLPKEQMVRVSAGRILRIIIYTLLLLCMINVGVYQYLKRHPVNLGYWVIQEKWKLLDELQEPVDWLILGDSSGNQGVNPAILSERLGGSVLNLCTVGASIALDDAWMLQRYVKRFGAPKGVVIVHAYDIWHRLLERPMLAQAPLVGDEKFDLVPQHLQTLSSRTMMMIDQYVPLYSQNVTLSNAIQYAWRRPPEPKITEQGYMPWNISSSETVLVEYDQHILFTTEQDQFVMSEDNRAALNRIQSLADQNQIPVYFANSPLFIDMMENESIVRYYNKVWAALRAITSNSPNLHVILTDPATYPIDQLAGVDHVTSDAADDFTRQIANHIEAIISHP